MRGTYLYPLRILGTGVRPNDANDYLEVVAVLKVGGCKVAVTRGGGIFVRQRDPVHSWEEAVETVRVLNLLVCELALNGLISEPVSTADIQSGKLIGRHIAIAGGWGNFPERNYGVLTILAASPREMGPGNIWWPPNVFWIPHHDLKILEKVDGTPIVKQLMKASETIPGLVASACYNAHRHNQSAAAVMAWVATEQVLSHFWEQLVAGIQDAQRQRRLKDFRTYTSSVQIEALESQGVLDTALATKLHAARSARNKLAHTGTLSEDGYATCLYAMTAMIEKLCQRQVDVPVALQASGGSDSPIHIPDPEFDLD
jgi:hypothetical protein